VETNKGYENHYWSQSEEGEKEEEDEDEEEEGEGEGEEEDKLGRKPKSQEVAFTGRSTNNITPTTV
jgi:hypothetical protein